MKNTEKEIQIIEEDRARMHRIVDERYDVLIDDIRNGKNLFRQRSLPLVSHPSVFKGKKPISITLPNGEIIPTSKWRSVATAILKDCNDDMEMHYRMMKLCGITAGRFRMLLSHDPSEMDVPLKIDDDLYFEGKFDTEYLIKMMTEKVLDQVGYDYSGISITIQNKQTDVSFEPQEDTSAEDENKNEDFSVQMM